MNFSFFIPNINHLQLYIYSHLLAGIEVVTFRNRFLEQFIISKFIYLYQKSIENVRHIIW